MRRADGSVEKPSFDGWAFALACVFALFCAFGYLAFAATEGGSNPAATPSMQIALIGGALVLAACFYCTIAFLFAKLDRRHRARADGQRGEAHDAPVQHGSKRTAVLKRALIFFACWIPYLIARFPGNMDSDTVWQLMEVYGLAAPTDHHPWLDTLLFGGFWRMGDALGSHVWSLMLFALIQMAVTAVVFSVSIAYLQRLDAPRWFSTLSKIFFALYPAIPLFAMSMAKESLFAWIWVLFAMMVFEVIRTRGACLCKPSAIVGLLALACLVMLTKKAGFAILCVTAIPLVIYCSKRRGRLIAVLGCSLLLYACLWNQVLLPSWGVSPGEQREMLSVPSQQIARCVSEHTDQITDSEWTVLDGAYDDARDMGTLYVPARADAIKDLMRNDMTSEQRTALYQLWLSWLTRYPSTCAAAFGANTYPLVFPYFSGNNSEDHLFYLDGIPTYERTLEVSYRADYGDFIKVSVPGTTVSDIDGLIDDTYRSTFFGRVSDILGSAYNKLAVVLWPIFNDALFATWIPLFVLFYGARTKRWGVAACAVPTLAIALSIAFGPVVIPRYIAPILYTTPLTAGALFMPKDQSETLTTSSRSSCGTSGR